MGGPSAEREVSLSSGRACAAALREHGGYNVIEVEADRDLPAVLADLSPYAVLNCLHGRWGEDGCVQGILEWLRIPYTHSGLLASALAMDKPMAKHLFAAAGIPVAEHRIVSRDEILAGDVIDRPYVVKPVNEGSSVGVHIVLEGDNEPLFNDAGWPSGDRVMVEKFIPGQELTVAVMGDRALAVTDIITGREFYDYDAKYAAGGSRHVLPADIEKKIANEAMRLAVLAHQTLGCRGVSRADFRLDGNDLYLLEINTQPGMTPTSLVPEQAVHAGMSFQDLVVWMVDNAECDS